MNDIMKVLYVDDEPDIRLIVELSLKMRPDMDICCAESGEAALALLRDGAWEPDLVVVDVMMPGMTGPDILAALRADPDTEHLPVIFMTARARPQDIKDYVAQGARGVITKPFDPMELGDQLLGLMDR